MTYKYFLYLSDIMGDVMVQLYPTQHVGHLLGKMMKEKMTTTIFQLPEEYLS